MSFLDHFIHPFTQKPLQKLSRDEARAQAQWQLLKKKLRHKIKEPSQRIKLESWGTQLFDQLRNIYYQVDQVLINKNPREKDSGEIILERLDDKCEKMFQAILTSLPPRRKRTKAKKQEAKWQIAVIKNIRDHLDFLDSLLFEIEEY